MTTEVLKKLLSVEVSLPRGDWLEADAVCDRNHDQDGNLVCPKHVKPSINTKMIRVNTKTKMWRKCWLHPILSCLHKE